jgi:hypothetical protein
MPESIFIKSPKNLFNFCLNYITEQIKRGLEAIIGKTFLEIFVRKIFLLLFVFGAYLFAFEGVYSTKKGDIRVQDVSGGIGFLILTTGGSNIPAACDLQGNAVATSKYTAVFQTNSDMGGCSVLFDFSQDGKMLVKSKGCEMFCTDRSSFDGEYKKTR